MNRDQAENSFGLGLIDMVRAQTETSDHEAIGLVLCQIAIELNRIANALEWYAAIAEKEVPKR